MPQINLPPEPNEQQYPCLSAYEGKPVIQLGRFFSFGLAKARIVIKFYENIKKFVETEGKEC